MTAHLNVQPPVYMKFNKKKSIISLPFPLTHLDTISQQGSVISQFYFKNVPTIFDFQFHMAIFFFLNFFSFICI